MPNRALARRRILAQGLATRPYATPLAAVEAFGAMQGQDLPGVLASVALRTAGGEVQSVLDALDAAELVRGYPMRGTVFLLPAVDAAWITELCVGPPLRAARNRQHHLGLDDGRVDRAREAAVAALGEAPRGMSRKDLLAIWEASGQPTTGGVGYHLIARFISENLIYHGPWNGKEQDIVLADGWVPAGSNLEGRFNGDRIAAVAELFRRYLLTHGPATIRDFAWWTKLPLKEIRAALPQATAGLETDGADEPSWWRPGLDDDVEAHLREVSAPRLLPGFDEFILGYEDRLFAMTDEEHHLLVPGNNGVFKRGVIVDGLVRGTWSRGGRAGKRTLQLEPFDTIPKTAAARLPKLFEEFGWVSA